MSKHVLFPTFSKEEIANIDKHDRFIRALDGSEYLPGVMGLNNLKKTDYLNVTLQVWKCLDRGSPVPVTLPSFDVLLCYELLLWVWLNCRLWRMSTWWEITFWRRSATKRWWVNRGIPFTQSDNEERHRWFFASVSLWERCGTLATSRDMSVPTSSGRYDVTMGRVILQHRHLIVSTRLLVVIVQSTLRPTNKVNLWNSWAGFLTIYTEGLSRARKQSQVRYIYPLSNSFDGWSKGIIHECFQGRLRITTFPPEREIAGKCEYEPLDMVGYLMEVNY